MSVFLELFLEFFKAGLFAVGGGLATLPFLYDMAERHAWLTKEMLPDMIAVSESTPGPLGINMATYAGFNAAGVLGSLVATLSLVLPSLIIIIIIAKFLKHFQEKPMVQSVFSTLRPTVTALIAAACWQVMSITLFHFDAFEKTGSVASLLDFKAIILFIILFYLLRKYKKHPIVYIASAAAVGILFKM